MTNLPSLFLVAFTMFLLGKTQFSSRGLSQENGPSIACSPSPPIATRGVLFSQLYQQQIAENIGWRYLEPLFEKAGLNWNQDRIVVDKLSDLGFSNNVFRVEVDNTEHGHNRQILVAKVFSDLAKERLDPNQGYMGQVDELIHRIGLGPKVMAHIPDALLLEHIDGQVLTESIIFDTRNSRGLDVCSVVGGALGRLHGMPGVADVGKPNMLWHALKVMLSCIDQKLELSTASGTTWTLAKLQDTIGDYRNRLEGLHVPCVPVGHGDFKLSNVMITPADEIRFIDFELTGSHYRGYDLAKFFRSSKQGTPSHVRRRHQEAFWDAYHHQQAPEDPTQSLAKALSQLEWEARLLEPMTWLEAASFFLSMATLDDPSQQDKWNGLAESRLLSFETMKADVTR